MTYYKYINKAVNSTNVFEVGRSKSKSLWFRIKNRGAWSMWFSINQKEMDFLMVNKDFETIDKRTTKKGIVYTRYRFSGFHKVKK